MSDHRLHTPGWLRLRTLILERDGGKCQINGPTCKGTATEVDHIEPSSEGGAFWDPTNLRAACKPCNARRGTQLLNARFKYQTRTQLRL